MSARERFREWRRRRRGLAARAQGEALEREALEREAARVRRAFAAIDWRPGDSPAPDGVTGGVPDGVAVRWGLAEDEGAIADLLELNGMPRWVAFEERFVVAEERGRVSAAVHYRMEPKRLLLGLLVADPWRGERRLAVALYAGAGVLARGLGAREVLARSGGAKSCGRTGYPGEARYARAVGGWRLDPQWPARERPHAFGASGGTVGEMPEGFLRRALALWGAGAVPFFGPFRE